MTTRQLCRMCGGSGLTTRNDEVVEVHHVMDAQWKVYMEDKK